ncbi:histidinol-phosphate transaminase [Paenibacillus sp.]|uniref:histidinol-phosphate transaminase n=1 Tax=Paenibacillus sp. TaxID=58172 RepID=UPI002D399BBC|nr:histidinol-phosphate transaminase [Paenibacillus sp.]HZG85256.1 histidinol-phosphate transaminase [Paenibacillus sp.]
MQPKARIMHLPVYQPGKPIEEVKRELGLTHVIKLASNENPFGCSPKAKEAIIANLDQANMYPDGASVDLKAALSALHGVEPDQIVFGAGSDEVILMIARAFLSPGDETIMADRTFPQYKHNAEIEGATVIEVPLKEGTHDLDAMLAAVTDKTKIIWVCNPNNPTSTIVTKDEVDAFLAKVPSSVMVVLDEAYVEYVVDERFPNGLELVKRYPNVVTLRTFSKAYGLASLRIGYGIGRPELIKSINQVREPFNTTLFAQVAALAAVQDQEFIARCREANAAGIAYLREQFDRLGLRSFPAHGNFVLVDVARDAKTVYEELLKKGVIVRGGHTASIGFPTMIRVTVGSEEQNRTFIEALTAVLEETAVAAE